MHDRATVARVMGLRLQGLGARRIAKCTNLPLSTVRDWLAGHVPAHARELDGPVEPRCRTCGHEEHQFSELGGNYVYLLGLYLGDGSIASHRRSVYKLRITLDTKYPGIIAAAALAMRDVRQGTCGFSLGQARTVWTCRRTGRRGLASFLSMDLERNRIATLSSPTGSRISSTSIRSNCCVG